MEGHAKNCAGRYWELGDKSVVQFFVVSTPCVDNHQFSGEEFESVEELSKFALASSLNF